MIDLSFLIGKLYDDFKKYMMSYYPNIDYRVIKSNGQDFIITGDFKKERLNLTLVNEIITEISYG